MDFKLDDSYTPNKIRVYAGTHYHDLVEVRTRYVDVQNIQSQYAQELMIFLPQYFSSSKRVCRGKWLEALCARQI